MMTKHMMHMSLRDLRRATNVAALLGGSESLDDGSRYRHRFQSSKPRVVAAQVVVALAA
jgi:hypothetical protein